MVRSDQAPSGVENPRRRWLQFSLRTLLLVVTVLCVWLAVVVNRARTQHEAVAAIRASGGEVHYEFEVDHEGILKDNPFYNGDELVGAEPPGPEWLRNLVGIDYFADVLRVDGADADAKTLSALHNLPRIKWLYFGSAEVDDRTLNDLNGRTRLEGLSLERTRITDAGLQHVARMQQLRELYLGGTSISDAGLAHIADLRRMEQLILGETRVTDAGVKHLAGMTRLENLNLSDTRVTDASIPVLSGLTKLRYLDIHGTQISDQGEAELERALPQCVIVPVWP